MTATNKTLILYGDAILMADMAITTLPSYIVQQWRNQ